MDMELSFSPLSTFPVQLLPAPLPGLAQQETPFHLAECCSSKRESLFSKCPRTPSVKPGLSFWGVDFQQNGYTNHACMHDFTKQSRIDARRKNNSADHQHDIDQSHFCYVLPESPHQICACETNESNRSPPFA